MKMLLNDGLGKTYKVKLDSQYPEVLAGREPASRMPENYVVIEVPEYLTVNSDSSKTFGFSSQIPLIETISPYHCRLKLEEGEGKPVVKVYDNHSSSGTLIDGVRLNGKGLEVRDGSTISLGTHSLKVKLLNGSLTDKLRWIF